MRTWTFVTLMILALLLAACGGGGEATEPAGGEPPAGAAGDAAAGEALYNQQVIGSTAGCVTCHSMQEGTTLVGPSLADIGTTAATREAGKSAEQYLHESIVQPDAYVVEGFPAGVMPQTFDQELSDQQLDDLVAFMLSLQ